MSVDRILLVSLDNLGDMVFASALAPPLRERFPKATLDIWCKEYTADVARLVPGVNDVIGSDPFWDRAPGRAKGSRAAFLRAMRTVRSRRYDVALLAAAPWRTAAAVAATRIPVRIGLRRRKNRAFLTDALPDENPREPVLSELARLLEPLGITALPLRYRLDPASLTTRRTRLMATIPDSYVALHPFASKQNRCVALPVWIDLARRLSLRWASILWIGSPSELDALRTGASDPAWRFIDRDSDGTLADTAAALSGAKQFIGHDSGPLHIAGAFGVPVLGIFAPGEPLRTFPQGVGPARMLARPSPNGITVDDILREIDAL
ncbi:MAG TPA: glycosyltransferase family 9 protein [Gemmatimonadaceae bacterium]|jgi:ADP-heptose:LPS heptosyltransferase|nr:glycosyltransferase family 9 protein [Gemmatimonadaceae bacterium]